MLRLTFDENASQQILQQIEFLFRRAVFPKLFTRRVQRGKKLHQHDGLVAGTTNKQKNTKKPPALLIATLHKKTLICT